MTKETYEQAGELMSSIVFYEQSIKTTERLLEELRKVGQTQVSVMCKGKGYDVTLFAHPFQLPELRQELATALEYAHERMKCTLQEKQEKLAEL